MRNGQSLIELLFAITFAGITIPVLFTGFVTSREGKAQESQRLLAIPRLREAQETIRVVREKDWNTFAVNGTYHPVINGNTWSLVLGLENIGGFTRSIVITDIQRDSNGVIVESGGAIDPSTKKVVASVSWSSPYASSVSSTTYVGRYLNNAKWVQTTESDFNVGTKTGVTVTNTDGGEVVLGAGGSANWCEPNLSIAALDLPKQGVANAIAAIQGGVFAGTGENASGVSFANVNISNANPPVASILGTFDGYKTNGVFGETNYAYLATDNNVKEIVIINLSVPPYTESGYFNAPGNGNGESIFVVGTTGYMITGSKLYNFDLVSKNDSRPLLDADGVSLSGTGKKVFVVGNYAYVAVDSTSSQLQIIDVSNSANLTVVGSTAVNGQQGRDIFVNTTGTRIYLATAVSATQNELFIIDVSTKIGSRPTIGSYDTNGMNPRGITVVPGNRAIIVGTAQEEYQVINIANEAQPIRCGGLNIDSGVNGGISSVLETDGDVYSYIITGDLNSELKIIEGGPGGAFSQTGTFESSTFDAQNQSAFYRIYPTFLKLSQTDITFQVAGADVNPLTGNCTGTTFNFVGPDGAATTYFTNSAAIPTSISGNYKNPSRCFRYKAFLSTTDITQSPTLYDVTVNYSP